MFAGLASALLARRRAVDDSAVSAVGTGAAAGSAAPAALRDARLAPYCGLANSGATCYLNSLLQALYCHDEFRAQVFAARSSGPVTKALQQLFADMQFGLCVRALRPLFPVCLGSLCHPSAPSPPAHPQARRALDAQPH